MVHRGRAVVVEHVAQVTARVAGITDGLTVEEVEKLGKGEHAAASAEALFDVAGDVFDVRSSVARLAHGLSG